MGTCNSFGTSGTGVARRGIVQLAPRRLPGSTYSWSSVAARERLPLGDIYVHSGGRGGAPAGSLRWAREQGCPWSEETSLCAAQKGQLEVITWLDENDCPCEWEAILAEARSGSHEDIEELAESYVYAHYY